MYKKILFLPESAKEIVSDTICQIKKDDPTKLISLQEIIEFLEEHDHIIAEKKEVISILEELAKAQKLTLDENYNILKING